MNKGQLTVMNKQGTRSAEVMLNFISASLMLGVEIQKTLKQVQGERSLHVMLNSFQHLYDSMNKTHF